MINAVDLTKKFGDTVALSKLTCTIPDGCIFGLVGSNGAGKSTLIRLLAGVYRADGGTVTIDGKKIFGNSSAMRKIAYVPDELYFLAGATIDRMAQFYANAYGHLNKSRLESLAKLLGLSTNKPIAHFSKGMKRQAATILALAREPEIMMFDETFDGLDPVMRSVIKRVIVDDVLDRKATVIITSHSLRELEDTTDQLALLHKGGLVLQSDVANLKTTLFKVQIAFGRDFESEDIAKASGCELLSFVKHGSVANVIMRGDRDSAQEKLESMQPVILDILPLSLEEVFVHETASLGYNFDDLLGGDENE